jgi:hypothetical protein
VAVTSDVGTLGPQKGDKRFCDTPITTDLLQPQVGQANDVDAPVAVENPPVALPEQADIAFLLARSWESLGRHHLLQAGESMGNERLLKAGGGERVSIAALDSLHRPIKRPW